MPLRTPKPTTTSHAEPLWTTGDGLAVRFYQGHATRVLEGLDEQSIQTIVTSPPYWGLREYGTGDPDELGLETTPEDYVANMVQVGSALHQVLRDDGTWWLNIGDSFDQDTGNLYGVPWLLALALRDWGWVLRMDNIWHKPSPMPEPVRNRCTKAHEYVFLLTKEPAYYYDHEAIKEEAIHAGKVVKAYAKGSKMAAAGDGTNNRTYVPGKRGVDQDVEALRNKRSVWTIEDESILLDWLALNHPDTLKAFLKESEHKGSVWTISHGAGYRGAHFATFPPLLAETCIKAGTSERGACPECGTAWRRVVEERPVTRQRPNRYTKRTGAQGTGNKCANDVAGVESVTVGWEPRCDCGHAHEPVPCVVLDPFTGTGTTAAVCAGLDAMRHCVGVDLSGDYLRYHAVPRVSGVLRSRPSRHHLLGVDFTRDVLPEAVSLD